MREIKFRAWDSSKMTSQIRLEFAHGLRLVSTDNLGFDMVGDDKCILMQFTGLKDKNGVEIYEGDVIEDDTWWYEVIWNIEDARFELRDIHNQEHVGLPELGKYHFVQGNIYQNPELLK